MAVKGAVAIDTVSLLERAVRIVAILAILLVAPLSVVEGQETAPKYGALMDPLPTLSALINADRDLVQLRDLSGAERDAAIKRALASKDFGLLQEQLAKEKFELDATAAKVIEARYLRPAVSSWSQDSQDLLPR